MQYHYSQKKERLAIHPVLSYPFPGPLCPPYDRVASLFPYLGGMMMAFISRNHEFTELGAAGIGAAVCESARYGGFGAQVSLSEVPLKAKDITPEEILICETQARMAFQVSPENTVEVMKAIQSQGGIATVIGEVTSDDKEVFRYNEGIVATIPNKPSKEILKSLGES